MSLSYQTITTPRLTTAYLAAGTLGKPRLLLLHGNVASAVFYQRLMEHLAADFEMLAPDFRCFGHSSALPIDATRGMRDFSDDVEDFVTAMGWDRFSIMGWSMGGGVAMQYAIDHPEKVESLILQAPLAPFGFGGSYGETGIPVEPAGLGSGAACANQALLQAIRIGDRTLPGQVIDSVYVAAGYKLPRRIGRNTSTLCSSASWGTTCARATAPPAPSGRMPWAATRACPTPCPCATATCPLWRRCSRKCPFCGCGATRT